MKNRKQNNNNNNNIDMTDFNQLYTNINKNESKNEQTINTETMKNTFGKIRELNTKILKIKEIQNKINENTKSIEEINNSIK